MRDAIQVALDNGIPVVKAAGNDGVDAFNDRSNRAPYSVVVGAIQSDGARRTGTAASNFGSTLDLFAPGINNHSAGATSDDAVNNTGGTSGAAAHVTGVIALMMPQLQFSTSFVDPAVLQALLTQSATAGVVSNAGAGSPNLLLYSLHTRISPSGPDVVVSDGNPYWDAEWTAGKIGGSGSWTGLTWEAQINGGSWQTVATGTASYVRRIYVNDQYVMNLRLTGTSAGETVSGTLTVYVSAP